MRKTIVSLVCGLALAAGSALAQPAGLLDIYKVKVKRDKTLEFESAIRKLADINRKKGDRWIAYSTEYGDSGTVYFSSRRAGYGDIENGMGAMMAAVQEAVGPSGMARMFADLDSMTLWGMGELRRRRADLSVNSPGSDEEISRLVATSRWIRTIRIDVKPGRMPDFIDAWKPWQAELGRVEPKAPVLVSVTESGPPALVVALYYKSLKDVDEAYNGVQKALASDTYRSYSRAVADLVSATNWEIHRIRPELSNPPDAILNADPAFWKPKPPARPKPAAEKPGEKK